MTTRNNSHQDPPRKPRDPDFVGAEAALRRAAKKARRRAFQTTGKVAVFIDGKVVWQRPDGSFIDEPEGLRKEARECSEHVGGTHVTALIRNPAEPDRAWEGQFRVDTGAVDCLVPRQHLEAIGLSPKGQRILGLADGGEVKMDVTVGQVEFLGDIAGATIVFGEAGTEPLLGVTALESVGIELDPRNQTLRRLPSTRLKWFRAKDSD